MPLYGYCELSDVSAKNLHRTYDASSTPTSTQVDQYIIDIYSQVKGVVQQAGYDVDNIHEVSSTVALSITSGDDVQIVVEDGSEFNVGDTVKLEGLTSGIAKWEFDSITAISSNTLTIATIGNNYDAASVTVYTVNTAMAALREINAVGAAWKAEESTFMGVSPNRSEHSETLRELYFGNDENFSGLWAIMNMPEFLPGATKTSDAPETTALISSYGSENSGDTDVEPRATVIEEF